MKNELIQVLNNETMTTSLLVAEKFNKDHKTVLRKIENLISEIEIGTILCQSNLFKKSEYTDAYNRTQSMYYLNRDGFTLLAMGFTGKEALKWKLTYIQAFNEMEKKLHSSTLPDNRLEIARIISRTPKGNLQALTSLFPEYFSNMIDPGSLEYTVEKNTSYMKWIEEYGITAEYITDFPTSDIYNNYARFCVENKFNNIMGKKTFYKLLAEDFHLVKKQKPDGFRYFVTA